MLKNYIELAIKEVEEFKGKGGELGVIEYHLECALNEKEVLEKDLKEAEDFIIYLKAKKENIKL